MLHLDFTEMLLRISLAFAAGFVVGWERESHGRPAGLRTNILACVAAAVSMMVAEQLLAGTQGDPGSIRADPARLGAGVLAGIGFLGAGTILRHEHYIRGVTTAATLWTVTILGLAFGAGLFLLGALGVVFSILTLLVLSALEKQLRSDWYASLTIVAALDSCPDAVWRKRIEDLGATVQNLKFHHELVSGRKTLTCDLKLSRKERFELASKAVHNLTQFPGVFSISWE